METSRSLSSPSRSEADRNPKAAIKNRKYPPPEATSIPKITKGPGKQRELSGRGAAEIAGKSRPAASFAIHTTIHLAVIRCIDARPAHAVPGDLFGRHYIRLTDLFHRKGVLDPIIAAATTRAFRP